jgi:collagenase-like PrtC family protease
VAVNGVQTLSYTCANLIGDLASLSAIGVGACRLSPQTCDMVAVAQTFRDVLDGRLHVAEAAKALDSTWPQLPFSNGFLHGRPGAEWVDRIRHPRSAAGAGD